MWSVFFEALFEGLGTPMLVILNDMPLWAGPEIFDISLTTPL